MLRALHGLEGALHHLLSEERPKIDQAIELLMRGTVALGGTLSGEQGIGVTKLPYLPLE